MAQEITTAKLSTLNAAFTMGMVNLSGLTSEGRTRTLSYCRQIVSELDRRTAPAAGFSLAARRRAATLFNQFNRELRLAEDPGRTIHPIAEAVHRVATAVLGGR